MTLQPITSRSNPRLKAVRRLLKAGFDSPAIVVEGPKLIREALSAGWELESLWCTDEPEFSVDCPIFQLPNYVYSSISPTKSGRSPLAVFKAKAIPAMEAGKGLDGPGLLLDQLQDPGNAGTLVRAALAFGFKRAFWHKPSVFPFHHACIRASAGAVFHLEHYLVETAWLEANAIPLVIGDLAGTPLDQFVWPEDPVLALGNEGHGFSEAVRRNTSHRVRIPIHKNSESLNVAGAGHILMYHYRSQAFGSNS